MRNKSRDTGPRHDNGTFRDKEKFNIKIKAANRWDKLIVVSEYDQS